MPHYEKWLIDNAILYLRYVLSIQYDDLTTEPNYRADFTHDSRPIITITGKRRTFTNILSCNLNLVGEHKIIGLDTTTLTSSDRWVCYNLELSVKGPAVDQLIKAAMRYACYCLNTPGEMNCCANSLQVWDAIYGVNEAKQVTCRLIIAQKPKPTTTESNEEANARRRIIIDDIEKLWEIITGKKYTKGVNIYDNCRLSGKLERKKEEGIGLHLIYKNFSLQILQPDINLQLESAKTKKYPPLNPLAISKTALPTSAPAAPPNPTASRKRGNIEPLDFPASLNKPSEVKGPPPASFSLQPKPLPPRSDTPIKPSASAALNKKPPISLGSAPTIYKTSAQRASGSAKTNLPSMSSDKLKTTVDQIVQDMKTNNEPAPQAQRQERADTSTWFNSPPIKKPK